MIFSNCNFKFCYFYHFTKEISISKNVFQDKYFNNNTCIGPLKWDCFNKNFHLCIIFLVCLAGYGRPNPTAACAKCPVGQYSSVLSNDLCSNCSAGETTAGEGSNVCSK